LATAHYWTKLIIAAINHVEEARMGKEMIAGAPSVNTLTLYIPDFLWEYSLLEQSLEEQKK
jgi:hypothetical protein